ncbi:uncharacterized protein DUF4241 [Saccharopolyspora erythraea NRRL 2338]|uniref:DUF4241 domain-containing protein n=1 Tax=Saccharopolyspora erythraea TaxID=1836 RepID=A0ABN1DSR7_SACER|nr:uncharacterized protein DUF4241 [Saccharopolyspora erythraea NRRL 2338]
MSPHPPDFDRLFAEGSKHDCGRLRERRVATVRVVAGAALRLPTGRVLACEPWTGFPDGAHRDAFIQRVQPGVYPVELVVATFSDPVDPRGDTTFDEVAAARLLIRPEPVAAWRLALREGQDDAELADGELYGYPVDGATGSFGSPEVFDGLKNAEDPDIVMDIVTGLEAPDKVAVYTDELTGDNLVIFSSGGDGYYGTWIGYTAGGEVACFVTDFLTLTAK